MLCKYIWAPAAFRFSYSVRHREPPLSMHAADFLLYSWVYEGRNKNTHLAVVGLYTMMSADLTGTSAFFRRHFTYCDEEYPPQITQKVSKHLLDTSLEEVTTLHLLHFCGALFSDDEIDFARRGRPDQYDFLPGVIKCVRRQICRASPDVAGASVLMALQTLM